MLPLPIFFDLPPIYLQYLLAASVIALAMLISSILYVKTKDRL